MHNINPIYINLVEQFMTSISTQVQWHHIPIPATSAFGSADLAIGDIGTQSPRMLITAGIHGDEGPWGAWAIRKLLERITPTELRGSIRIIPVTNPLAMQADKRNAPVDQLDLNRSYPGSANGSYTERVAHTIVEHALPDVDYVIDLHGGGSWCINSFVFEMAGGEALSGSFPAPFVVKAPSRDVTLTGYAKSQGLTVTAVEMGGRSQFESQWTDKIADGLYRALATVGIIEPEAPLSPMEAPLPVASTTVLRPKFGGIFIPAINANHIGTIVEKDTLLGTMLHPMTQDIMEEFRAPYDETAIMLLRPFVAQLEGGAMTYVISQPIRQ